MTEGPHDTQSAAWVPTDTPAVPAPAAASSTNPAAATTDKHQSARELKEMLETAEKRQSALELKQMLETAEGQVPVVPPQPSPQPVRTMTRLEMLKQQATQPKPPPTPPDALEIYRKKYIKPWRHTKYLWMASRAHELEYNKYPRRRFPNGPCVTHDEWDRWEDLCHKETRVRKQWKRRFAKGPQIKKFELTAGKPNWERCREPCFAASQMPMAGCATPLEGGLISKGSTQVLPHQALLVSTQSLQGTQELCDRSPPMSTGMTQELLAEVEALMSQKQQLSIENDKVGVQGVVRRLKAVVKELAIMRKYEQTQAQLNTLPGIETRQSTRMSMRGISSRGMSMNGRQSTAGFGSTYGRTRNCLHLGSTSFMRQHDCRSMSTGLAYGRVSI